MQNMRDIQQKKRKTGQSALIKQAFPSKKRGGQTHPIYARLQSRNETSPPPTVYRRSNHSSSLARTQLAARTHDQSSRPFQQAVRGSMTRSTQIHDGQSKYTVARTGVDADSLAVRSAVVGEGGPLAALGEEVSLLGDSHACGVSLLGLEVFEGGCWAFLGVGMLRLRRWWWFWGWNAPRNFTRLGLKRPWRRCTVHSWGQNAPRDGCTVDSWGQNAPRGNSIRKAGHRVLPK